MRWDFSATTERKFTKNDRTQKEAVLASDWLILFGLSATAERNLTKNDRTQKRGRPGPWLADTFRLLCNCWTEFDKNWQDAKPQHPLSSLCFSGRSKKIAIPVTDEFIYFRFLLCNPWTDYHKTWQDAKELNVLYQVSIFGQSKEKIATHVSATFRCWTEFDENWQYARTQRLLSSLCLSGWSKKMAALASDWLIHVHVRLLICYCWTEFDQTWQDARPQRPLPHLCFSTDQKTKMVGLASDWLILFDFLSATTERNLTKIDRTQELNVHYPVGIFRADRIKMAVHASDWLIHFLFLLDANAGQNFTKIYTTQKLNVLYYQVFFWT